MITIEKVYINYGFFKISYHPQSIKETRLSWTNIFAVHMWLPKVKAKKDKGIWMQQKKAANPG